MTDSDRVLVAIVDFGMGNLFSVRQACQHCGLAAKITSSREEILAAESVILPGVGAYGDAMATLERLDLVSALKDFAASGRPLVGICLGLQLLFRESEEFGRFKGLDILKGSVVRFENPAAEVGFGDKKVFRRLKVPQVGWNRIWSPASALGPGQVDESKNRLWTDSLLSGLAEGEFMYFVHSYYGRPTDPKVALAVSNYGGIEFCSAVQRKNVVAFQFHPERSGRQGLTIYHNLARLIKKEALGG